MKFLRDQFRDFQNEQNTRFIFVGGEGAGKTLETAETEENIDQILEHPLEFSLRYLDILEKKADQMTPAQKLKFRDLVGYHLGLVSAGQESTVPRILFQVQWQTPKLFRFLGLEMQRKIRALSYDQREKLKKSLEKSSRWSFADVARVCGLYRFLEAKAVQKDGTVDPLFKEVKEKLIQKAIPLAYKFEVSEGGKVKASVGKILANESREKTLTAEQKLLLLEIYRLFPNTKDWGSDFTFARWTELTKSAGKDLFRWSQGETNDPEKNPNYMMAWELLDSLAEDLTEGSTELEELQAQTDTIRRLVKRGNATQFLAFARKQDVLLPVHLNALRDILANRDDFLADNVGERHWLKETSNNEEINKLRKEKRKTEREKAQLEDEAFKKVLEEATEETVETYNADKEEKEVLEQEFEEEYLLKIETDLLPSLEEKTNQLVGNETDEGKKQKLQNDLNYTKERLLRVVAEVQEIRGEEGELSSEDIKSLLGRTQKAISTLSKEQGRVHFLDNLEEKNNRYTEVVSSLKSTRESLRKDFSFTKDLDVKLKEQTEQIQEIENREWELLREDEGFREFNDAFLRPQEIAEEVENKYWKKLEHRIKSHQVRAADLAVVDDTSFDPADGEVQTERQKLLDFRRAFKEVLTLQLDKIEREGLLSEKLIGQGTDRYAEWFEILDRELGHTTFKTLLQENLHYNIREHFGDDQIVSELLEGAQQYYRSEISDRLSRVIPEGHQDEFFSQWKRLNRKVDSPAEIALLTTDLDQALNLKETTMTKIEEEKRQFEALLTAIEKQNEGGEEHGKKEKEKVEPVFDKEKENLLWGKEVEDEDGTKRFVPGKQGLTEATVQTRELRTSVLNSLNPFLERIPYLQSEARKMTLGEEVSENIQATFQEEFKEFFVLWKTNKRQLKADVMEMKGICEEIFPASFAATFFASVQKALSNLDEQFKGFEEHVKKNNFVLTGKESFFVSIMDGLKIVESFTNFRDGFWVGEAQKIQGNFEDITKGTRYLKELKFFDDATPQKHTFQQKFEDVRVKFLTKFNGYEKNIRNIQRVINKDSQLSPADFYKKFGFERAHIQDILEEHKKNDKEFYQSWEKFQDPNFLGSWLSEYDRNPESRAEAIKEFAHLERIADVAEKVELDSTGLKKWFEEYQEKHEKNGGFFGRLRSTQWQQFSIYDIYRTIKESFEKHEMNWKRDSDRAVASLGMHALGTGNNFLGRIGQRFKQMVEESEIQRIKEFETQYHDQNGWVIREVLYKTNNPDEARACINLLKEKGFLRWDDPMFWRTLMRLQGGTKFNIPEDQNLSSHAILEKVKSACETIWTRDVFRQWDTSIDADLKKAKDGFVHEFGTYENDDKPRVAILSSMLKQWSQGRSEEVDPARYECFLFEAFRLGKMNGQPDQRWYFLVMGLSILNPRTGQSILPRDILMRLNGEFLARFPHMDFLADKSSPKLKGRIVPEGTPGAQERPWNYNDYREWGSMLGTANGTFNPTNQPAASNTERFFYQVVHMSPYAGQRIQRMARLKDEPDHDDGVNYQADWDQDQAVQALTQESNGADKYSYDFWRSYLSGFDKMMRYTKEFIDERDRDWGNSPEWLKEKKRILFELGNNIKTTLTVTQTLQGNYHGSSRTAPTTFNEKEWNEDSDYSINAEKSRQSVNKMMRHMFDKSGEKGEFYEVLDYKSTNKYGQKFDHRSHQTEWKEKNQVVMDLLSNEYGNKKYFTNTDLIERALKAYGGGEG